MPPAPLLPPALRARLRHLLEAHACVAGHVQLEDHGPGAAPLFVLRGQRANGAPVFIWEVEPAFKRDLEAYVADTLGVPAAVVEADLAADAFRVQPLSAADLARRQAQAAAAAAATAQQLQQQRDAARPRTPYGPALAQRVAATLRRGRSLGYSHRDYCGMGLEYADGHFRYGELYDGSLIESTTRTFATEPEFVAWLAQQSDQSLSRREAPDAWAWDNQTITRERLEQFVA